MENQSGEYNLLKNPAGDYPRSRSVLRFEAIPPRETVVRGAFRRHPPSTDNPAQDAHYLRERLSGLGHGLSSSS